MMPNFVLQKVADALNDDGKPIKGSRILLLGVTYKADVARHARVAEPRGPAPARSTAAPTSATATRGSRRSSSTTRVTSVPWSAEEVAAADCVVVLTAAPGVPRRAPLGERASSSSTRATSSRAGRNVSRI